MAEKKQEETVLSVKHVSKDFALPHEKNSSIKSSVVNVFRKKDRTIEVQHALKDISFEIKKGEFFGILGRNGSGKSTLLKILAEIYQPTKGSVHKKGKLVPFIELGVGFNPELTGRENVYLNGALLGFSRKEIDEKYDDIVKFAELEDFMDQKLKNYSSGMQVRLAFSVAVKAEADILLVDEVLAVGDADFQRKCFDYFRLLKKRGTTVAFVTHDMAAVRDFCHRAVLIENGVIKTAGDAEKVSNEYLKLFNQPEEDSQELQEYGDNRWGNGELMFGEPQLDIAEKRVRLTLPIESKTAKTLEDVRIGVDFYDTEKNLVTGTSSDMLAKKGLVLASHERQTVTFEMDNIFSGKKYRAHITLKSMDGMTVYDDWRDAFTLADPEKTNTYFPVMLGAKMKVE